jgi:hypothetical protein
MCFRFIAQVSACLTLGDLNSGSYVYYLLRSSNTVGCNGENQIES